jgi:drug/metabolite transporter (DMT)-like permease
MKSLTSWAALPVFFAIAGNVLYHCAQKSTPPQANPFLSLGVSFGTASLGCLVLYLATGGRGLGADLGALSWTSVALGLSVIVIELGFLLAYRSGWRIGLLSLVVTISLTLVLLPIGRVFFGERLGLATLAGVAVSLVGLALITLQAAP